MAEMSGRGAWSLRGKDNGSPYYCFKTLGTMDGNKPDLNLDYLAVHYGVKAIQNRLGDLGYRHPVLGKIPVTGKFGPRTMWGVQWFQKQNGLKVDGVFGRVTAHAFWRPLVMSIGHAACGRPDLLWGEVSVESWGGDPGAVSRVYKSENGPDLGLCQINTYWNPSVTLEHAFNAAYALLWSANNMALAFKRYDDKGPILQEQCAIARHNSHVQADAWYAQSLPPSQQILDYVLAVQRAARTI